MTFEFRPAVRENVGLILGLAGPSGSGKTFSAMRLAKGMSDGKAFAVIDTENGRAKHYADKFTFDHGDLRAPFSPKHYQEAIAAADAAGYPVIVVDSASHEHAGDGGILDMQIAELERMAKGNENRREAMRMASWIAPKMAHKRMVSKLLQVRAHLILCFRAEAKVDMIKVDGRLEVRPKASPVGLEGWIPVCEKTLPYELTASFLLEPNAPGIPKPIKLQEQHRAVVDLSKPLDEKAGEALAQWARGGAPRTGQLIQEAEAKALEGTAAIGDWWKTLSKPQQKELAPERVRLREIAQQADATPKTEAPAEQRVDVDDETARDWWDKS